MRPTFHYLNCSYVPIFDIDISQEVPYLIAPSVQFCPHRMLPVDTINYPSAGHQFDSVASPIRKVLRHS